jgi:alpha-galactosidase
MIRYDRSKQLAILETAHTSYWISLSAPAPVQLYYGPTLNASDADKIPVPGGHSSFDAELWRERAEYPVWDGRTFGQTALRADEPIFLETEAVEAEETELTFTLADPLTGHRVLLKYSVDVERDTLVKSMRIVAGSRPLLLRRAASGACCLPERPGCWTAHYAAGTWASEFQLRSARLAEGKLCLGSSRGMSGPYNNPAVIVEDGRTAYAFLMGWSGCWQMVAEESAFGNARVTSGFDHEDFRAELQPGEALNTPPMYLSCSAQGVAGVTRLLHTYQREVLHAGRGKSRVLYNSWEATTFAVNAKEQMALAERAAAMGVELFVVDDGWFGQRSSDLAGLGDWYVNAEKFPNGLEELIGHVQALGMDFGLWVEPEAVNPDSDLFRAHPDWIHRLQDREPVLYRNQYLLDFGVPAAEAFALSMLRGLLQRYGITYLKWDMNRPFADIDEQANPLAREKHVAAMYRILDALRAEFPGVTVEACSGGGARVDLGMTARTDQFWLSDNTDPYERLFIQDGCYTFYSPAHMSCWVTDTPKGSRRTGRNDLLYKFHVAMCGLPGVGADISKFIPEEMALCKTEIARYKTFRHLIAQGDYHALRSPLEGGYSAMSFVRQDQKEFVLMAFLHSQRFGRPVPRIRLMGLDPDAQYRCAETDEHYAGSTLMHLGLALPLRGDFDSAVLHFLPDGE